MGTQPKLKYVRCSYYILDVDKAINLNNFMESPSPSLTHTHTLTHTNTHTQTHTHTHKRKLSPELYVPKHCLNFWKFFLKTINSLTRFERQVRKCLFLVSLFYDAAKCFEHFLGGTHPGDCFYSSALLSID